MKLKYDYGLLRYIPKYLAGSILLLMVLLFAFLSIFALYLMVLKGVSLAYVFFVLISVAMIVLCSKGAYYLFRFADQLNNSYVFDSFGFSINPETNTIFHRYSDVKKVVHLKYPKVIEIFLNGASGKPIVIMTNTKTGNSEFYAIVNAFKNNGVIVETKYI